VNELQHEVNQFGLRSLIKQSETQTTATQSNKICSLSLFTMCSKGTAIYCLHSPSQAHNAVHAMLSLTHLQRSLMQPVLQPQRFNSGQQLAASGNVVKSGCQQLSIMCHPQSQGSGSFG
jgi:hypothetical protein